MHCIGCLVVFLLKILQENTYFFISVFLRTGTFLRLFFYHVGSGLFSTLSGSGAN